MIFSAHELSPTTPSTGPSLRTPTQGPELDLVHAYIAMHLPDAPRGQRRTVFLEPRLESGYPDVVVVHWHVGTAEQWQTSRRDLTKFDIRILHYLSTYGATTTEDLKARYYSPISPSLERLHDAGLVWRTTRSWRACSLNRIFAVRRIIAIEAKVHEWRKGMQQAAQNTWFASESYLLLGTLPRQSNLAEQATRWGVGVITKQHSITNSVISARPGRIPVSYASWLFNEWVWRFM